MTTEMILFLDIETTRHPQSYYDLPEDGKEAFCKRFRKEIAELQINVEDPVFLRTIENSLYNDNAAFYAEYGRVVCISIGFINHGKLHIKSFYGKEEDILIQFAELANKFDFLCAHNGLEFDFAFLTRKYFMHRLPPPRLLNNFGKKPWEMALLDTLNIWRASSTRYTVSLIQLAYALGLPSPKQDMQGADVPDAFYNGKLADIIAYCEGDVITLVNVWRVLRGEPTFISEQVLFINHQPIMDHENT
jgi:3'-5' exonuclease